MSIETKSHFIRSHIYIEGAWANNCNLPAALLEILPPLCTSVFALKCPTFCSCTLVYAANFAHYEYKRRQRLQSDTSSVKVRWPSWAPVPDKPTVPVDVKQHPTTVRYLRNKYKTVPLFLHILLPLPASRHVVSKVSGLLPMYFCL